MRSYLLTCSLGSSLGWILLSLPAAAQESPPFPSALHLAPINNPSGLVAADLDGDGRLDLAASENPHGGGWLEPPSDVSVLLNAGAGRFHPCDSYPLGWHATGLAAGDLDGDGDLDLAVPHHMSGGLMLLLNDGKGGFRTRLTVDGTLHSSAVALADLDGNGELDLVAADEDALGVVVYLGRGAGLFERPRRHPVPSPSALAVGDLDGDGVADLVATAAGALWTLRGDGTGSFHPPQIRSLPFGIGAPALADLDGDGDLDLAAGAGVQGILLLPGDGIGGWSSARFVSAGVSVSSQVVVDFDQEGTLDLVAFGEGRVVRLLGQGDGSFGEPQGAWALPAAGVLAVGELDGDGRLDVAVAGWDSVGITVLSGRGRGGLGIVEGLRVKSAADRSQLGDLDGDGWPDLVLHGGDEVLVHRGRGDGRFERPQGFAFSGGWPLDHPLVLTDVDVDGRLDVVVAGDTGIETLLGTGAGALARPLLALATPRAAAIALDDLQGDGLPDLVVVESDSISPPLPGALLTALGLGSGSFGPARRLVLPGSPTSVASGDLDDDGHPDVVLATGGELWVLLGVGDGRLQPPLRTRVGAGPQTVAIGHLDPDGRLDVALAGGGLEVLHGDGTGGFLHRSHSACGPGGLARRLALEDVDGDGDLDAVLDGGAFVSILLGSGTGRFEFVQLICPADSYASSALGDLDLDGDTDLVIVDPHFALGAAYLNRTVELD